MTTRCFTLRPDGSVAHLHYCRDFAKPVADREGLKIVKYSPTLYNEWRKRKARKPKGE